MYHGSCLCKAVKLTISCSITDIIHCHCSLCRKSSGTAYATNGFIETNALTVIKGKEYIQFYEVKPGKKRHFCKQCASPLFSSNDENPSKLRLRLGILDSDISERPQSHNFVTSKANWDEINADIPHYDTYEPSRLK